MPPSIPTESAAAPRSPRRGRPRLDARDDARNEIIKAALALFKRQGLDATSLDHIAQLAGASKATIYRHFSGKDELAEAAVARDGDRVLRAIARQKVTAAAPMDRIRQRCAAIAAFSVKPRNSDLYRLCLSAVPRIPAVGLAFVQTGVDLRQTFLPDIAAAQTLDQLRPTDPQDIAAALYDIVILPLFTGALLTRYDEAALRDAFAGNWDRFLRAEGSR